MIHKSTTDQGVAEIATVHCPNDIQQLPTIQFSFFTKLSPAVQWRRMILYQDSL